MRVTVLLFARYREQVGQKELTLELPGGATVRDAAGRLEADHGDLTLKGALAAINEEYAAPDTALSDGDALALFPPVAGGSGAAALGATDHLFVTEGVLELAHLQSLATASEYGAVASFVGTVRSPNHGKRVRHIAYEGYEGMMLAQMKVVASELRARFDLGKVVLAHRLGELTPGEASIAVVVSSEHRRDALQAVQAGIDRCKELLPVWKLEVTEDGERWVEGSSAAAETL